MVSPMAEPSHGNLESCRQKFGDFVPPSGEIYCNWTWDSVLCWPPTKAAAFAVQNCPKDRGIDGTKLVYKKCLPNGFWEGRIKGHNDSPQGWTNYTTCFTPEMFDLFKMLHAGSEDNAKIKLDIAERTRTLEIVGFSVSLLALFFSLAIFWKFRGLRNGRTRIHKNLFIAMGIQVIVRLTLYLDQVIVKKKLEFWQGIHNTSVLCEISYILLEYARTAMFMWMFVEGLYLHNMITVAAFRKEQSYHKIYSVIGWGSPVAITGAWIFATVTRYKSSKCWWGYNLTAYFWILEGPRLTVVGVNFLFLLNVIRVLVVKLRQSKKSEIEQIRKAVRATAVLLPLLGITNVISMTKSPLEKSVWEFALWSYATHFLTSFQGFFIAFLYCFLNGEVRAVITKSLSTYLSLRKKRVNRCEIERNNSPDECALKSQASNKEEKGAGREGRGGGGGGGGGGKMEINCVIFDFDEDTGLCCNGNEPHETSI